MRLILGRAGTGKKRAVLELLQSRAKKGETTLLLVPEQSSFSYEKKLYFMLPAAESRYVEVMSFTKLADELLKRSGGGAKPRLDDAAKAALIRRAVIEAPEAVAYYRRNRNDFSFFQLVSGLIGELKNAGVTPESLAALSRAAPTRLTETKFREIAEIYANYEKLLNARYEDSAGRLEAAAKAAGKSGFFQGKMVIVDGFTGFTEPEIALLGRVIAEAAEFAAVLMCDGTGFGAPLFRPVQNTARRLCEIAAEKSPAVEYLEKRRTAGAAGIASLEEFLVSGAADGAAEGVFRIAGEDRYDELEQVAAEIVRLIREEGYRFSDIAVITRDLENYRAVIRRTFRLFDIPYFADWTENARFTAAASFVFAALALLDDFSAENLMGLLKTRLTDLTEREIASLEQYLFVWNIDREQLLLPFRSHPEEMGGQMNDAAKAVLAEAERARLLAADWVTGWIGRAKGRTAGEMIREIYFLMERCGAAKKLHERGEAGTVFSLLDRLFRVLGGDRLPPGDIAEIAKVLFSGAFAGEIPESLEQVQVGSAERIRTDSPRAVFVVGLVEGEFPRADFEAPVFTFSERDFINRNGGEIARSFDGLLMMEELHFYNALTTAGERVYLSYPLAETGGSPLTLNAKIERYIELFSPPFPPSGGDRFSKIVNLRTARRAYLEGGAVADAIREADAFDFIAALDAVKKEPEHRLFAAEESRTAGSIVLSPSQIESFGRCRFQYFMDYTLRVRPLQPAALSPLQAGNFIHAVLEQVFSAASGNLRDKKLTELYEYSELAAERYIAENLKEATAKSYRTRYLAERLKRQAQRLVRFMREEQLQSLFTPAAFELSIGAGGELPPKRLELPDGTEVFVTGKVDRADVAEMEGKRYLRVVDYKTGNRKFSLDDVVYGLNMQMLIYLFTLTGEGARYADALPAGVLYMPADPRPPRFDAGKQSEKEAYRMDGLLLDDKRVIAAMERETKGVFIPVRTKKDGDFDAASRQRLARLETMGSISRHVDHMIREMAERMKEGDIAAEPAVSKTAAPCDYCAYTAVCRRDRVSLRREIAAGAGEMFRGGDGDA